MGWPEGAFSSNYFTDRLIGFMDSDAAKGKPFFAYAAYTAPHWPLQAIKDGIEAYLPIYAKGWDQVRSDRFDALKQTGYVPDDLNYPDRIENVPAWESLDKEQQRIEAKKMAIYGAMISNLNANIGRLLRHLKNTGRLDNTLVVFMSDNGAATNDMANNESLIGRQLTLWLRKQLCQHGQTRFVCFLWAALGQR